MKNDIYSLGKLFLASLLVTLLLPFYAFAQSLPPIPDVGEGICVSGCGTPSTTTLPTATPEEDTTSSTPPLPTPQAIATHLQTAIELDNQTLQKLNEEKYAEVPPIINDAIESLTDVRDSLKTDPASQEVCEDNPKARSKIDRLLQSSIKDHEKAASIINRINIIGVSRMNNYYRNNENKEEESLSKLVESAKRFIKRATTRTHRVSRTMAVCGVRG